jgi:SAM domain (Sterile alpha motif)
MDGVAEWLEKLGMSEYAQRFAENRIDFSVLPEQIRISRISALSSVIVANCCVRSPSLMPRRRR